MSYLSTAYNLVIQAESLIPGATALHSAEAADLHVWLGKMPDWRDAALLEAQAFYSTPYEDDHGEPVLRVWNVAGSEYIRLLYADNTEFILDRRGTQIWVTWPQSQTLEDAATYLLGPVLGLVLRLRGVTCLHASAVVLGERAIALVGASGAGKSTTAAAFAGAGYQVLADDIVALDEVADRFWVRPAYPRVRLWPSSVEALFGSEDALPLMTPTWDKRYLDLAESRVGFQRQPVTLAAIYVLDERSSNPAAPFVESLPDNQKLVTLVANTYANYLLEKPMRAAEFGSLGRLCRQIPLRKITPHADPKFIPKLCQSIVEDVQNLPRPLMRFARSVENEAENQSASLEQLCIA